MTSALPPDAVVLPDADAVAREAAERELRQIRDRAQRELDKLEEVLDTFRKLEPKQLIADEALYRELRDRFGQYFEGGMGAEALQRLLEASTSRVRVSSSARPSAPARARRRSAP